MVVLRFFVGEREGANSVLLLLYFTPMICMSSSSENFSLLNLLFLKKFSDMCMGARSLAWKVLGEVCCDCVDLFELLLDIDGKEVGAGAFIDRYVFTRFSHVLQGVLGFVSDFLQVSHLVGIWFGEFW